MDTRTLLEDAVGLIQEAIDCPFEADPKKWEAWCAQWRPRAQNYIATVRGSKLKATRRDGVPEDFKGSEAEELLKRAGALIECGFSVYTVRQRSTGKWINVLVLEDQDKQQFAYAFVFDDEATMALLTLMLNGLKTIEKMQETGARA